MLTIHDLSKSFPADGSGKPVLRDLSLHLEKGVVMGLVGESGAGKSTLGRCILGLDRPDRGKIRFQGIDLTDPNRRAFPAVYARMQMIFQDPGTHLNPWMRVGDLVREPLANLTALNRRQRMRRAAEMLDAVGLSENLADRFPRQLSGGQCQRVAIARALVVRPDLLVCDEALSSQDAPLQLRILNLLQRLRREMGLTCLFITHDLTMARYFCGRIAVMKAGRIIAAGSTGELFRSPPDPYTRLLMESRLRL